MRLARRKHCSMDEALSLFLEDKIRINLRPKSIRDYRKMIGVFIDFIGRDKDVRKLRDTDIEEYAMYICTKGLSDGTKASYLRNAKVFLNWICNNGYNRHIDPSKLQVPKMPKKVVKIYDLNELEMIFDVLQLNSTPWIRARNYAVILAMYDSGLRQEEVCTLEVKNISFAEHNMLIKGKGGKERYAPLGKATEEAFRSYLEACPYTSDFLFLNHKGFPMTTNSVRLMVSRINRRLPFELSSHKLRHNFGTNYCIDQLKSQGKVDIYSLMYIMGHEDIKTTQRYLHFAMKILATHNHLSHLDFILQKK